MEENEDQQTTAAEDNDEITENDVQPGPTLPKFHPASKTSHSSSKGHEHLLSRML